MQRCDHALRTLEHGRVYSVVLPSYLHVSRCFKGCWIPLPQILGSSSSRRMAKGQSGLVPKDPSIGLPWIDSIRARPLPGGLWVTNRFSGKAGSYSLPSIKKRVFMIDYVMNEPPPERLIWAVDTDTLVINGDTLLLEKFDCAPLMGRNQFQVSSLSPADVDNFAVAADCTTGMHEVATLFSHTQNPCHKWEDPGFGGGLAPSGPQAAPVHFTVRPACGGSEGCGQFFWASATKNGQSSMGKLTCQNLRQHTVNTNLQPNGHTRAYSPGKQNYLGPLPKPTTKNQTTSTDLRKANLFFRLFGGC